MANRIKGITVEIGGDTTKLSKALEGVNKDIKGTQTQLKDVQKLLKLDPTNTELLSQKHKVAGRCGICHQRKAGSAENCCRTGKYRLLQMVKFLAAV